MTKKASGKSIKEKRGEKKAAKADSSSSQMDNLTHGKKH
jgi:hypothetical protein